MSGRDDAERVAPWCPECGPTCPLHGDAGKVAAPCWCRLLVGYVTHAEGATCPTREYWLEVEDSERVTSPD